MIPPIEILYVEKDNLSRELFSMEIEAEFNCEIIKFNSSRDATNYLAKHPEISIAILGINEDDYKQNFFYQYLTKEELNIPTIIISQTKNDNDYTDLNKTIKFLKKPISPDILKNSLSNLIPNHNLSTFSHYCKVELSRFLNFNNTPCDIFLKLSDNKYIKIVHGNELYDAKTISKYIDKNVKYLYIRENDFVNFANDYTKMLISSLHHDENSTKIDTQLSGISVVHEIVSNLGIDQHSIKTIDNIAKSTINTLCEASSFSNLFKSIIKKENFLYEHSLLAAYLSDAIALKMYWNTDATLKKLAIASFLHDILLKDVDEHLIEYADLSDKSIPADLKRKLELHPLETAEIIRNSSQLPPDVDKIIEFHHERPDGSGFPRKADCRVIPPIACIFIMAEDLSHRIYHQSDDIEHVKKVIEEFKKIYNCGYFEKPLQGLINIFTN